VAVDATARPHLEGGDGAGFVTPSSASWACRSWPTSRRWRRAGSRDAGADAVSTTLSGYTPYSRQPRRGMLIWSSSWLLVCASRSSPKGASDAAEARQALERGAFAVVVGSAITRPQLITQRFVQALRRHAWMRLCPSGYWPWTWGTKLAAGLMDRRPSLAAA